MLLSPPGTAIAFLFVSFVFWELGLAFCLSGVCKFLGPVCAGGSLIRLGAPKYGWTEMQVALHLQTGPYWLLPDLRELPKSVFLSAIFGSCYGSWEDSIFCTLLGNASFVHGVIQCCQVFTICTSWNLARYLKGLLKQYVAIWSEVGQTENWYSEPDFFLRLSPSS